MKRTTLTLLTTVAALALSTAIGAAQNSTTPNTTDQTQKTTTPSTSSSPTTTSPSTSSPSATTSTPSTSSPSASSSTPSTSSPSASTSTPSTSSPSASSSTPSTSSPSASTSSPSTKTPTAQQNSQPSTNQSAQQPSSNQSAQTPSSSQQAAQPTAQQSTQISAAIQQANVSPVRVNFALNVGVAVPTSVRLSPLPSTIVSIVPQYRGYSYFVTDERIVIVEPSSHKIVYVMQREGRSHASATTTTTTKHKLELSKEQRASIKKHATVKQRTTTTGSSRRVTVEETIPADVELHEFSDVVVKEVPSVREYRYINRGDDVVVVDPGSRRVLEVIE